MTAAQINPSGTVTGEIDATGCNIGVYYDTGVGSVNNADIHGANYFGILVNGDVNTVAVDITDSAVHQIGESTFNGAQHGVAIYYRAFGTGTAAGTLSGNNIYKYQKGGIVVNGAGTTATVKNNIVTGEGPITYIAQNGIQVGYGATAGVKNNTVSEHSYNGPNFASDGGILVVGGDCYGGPLTVGTQIIGNTVTGNDIGVFLSNLDGSCGAPTEPTNVKVLNNVISKNGSTNTTGGGTIGYQAGISDVGNNDKLINNKISGTGYQDCLRDYCVAIDADVSFTNNPKVHANVTE